MDVATYPTCRSSRKARRELNTDASLLPRRRARAKMHRAPMLHRMPAEPTAPDKT